MKESLTNKYVKIPWDVCWLIYTFTVKVQNLDKQYMLYQLAGI